MYSMDIYLLKIMDKAKLLWIRDRLNAACIFWSCLKRSRVFFLLLITSLLCTYTWKLFNKTWPSLHKLSYSRTRKEWSNHCLMSIITVPVWCLALMEAHLQGDGHKSLQVRRYQLSNPAASGWCPLFHVSYIHYSLFIRDIKLCFQSW